MKMFCPVTDLLVLKFIEVLFKDIDYLCIRHAIGLVELVPKGLGSGILGQCVKAQKRVQV